MIVSLVDTPGFNDLERPDMEVLGSIVEYLRKERQGNIVGIIYMHRITDKRILGSSRMNLRMLQALCGEHFFQNVVLATTMWGTVPKKILPDLETREAELNGSTVFWADMLERGSKYSRYENTIVSAREIIGTCLERINAPTLNIVLEIRRGLSLEDTSAGRILTEELRKREEKRRQELLEEEAEEKQYLQQKKAEKEAEIKLMGKSLREEQLRVSCYVGRRGECEERRHRHRDEERWFGDSPWRDRRDDTSDRQRQERDPKHGGHEKIRKFFGMR